MKNPLYSRKVNGRRVTVFVPGAKRYDVTCKRCGVVGHDLLMGYFFDQWALEHLRTAHPDTYKVDFGKLYDGKLFDAPFLR